MKKTSSKKPLSRSVLRGYCTSYLFILPAMIYFAIENGVVYATCMAQPMTNNEWEICKLAADERYEGHGAGSAVFKACMDYALENGANKLIILSNSILKPALHIYEKYGFYEISVDNTHHYKRVDIQFEYTAK